MRGTLCKSRHGESDTFMGEHVHVYSYTFLPLLYRRSTFLGFPRTVLWFLSGCSLYSLFRLWGNLWGNIHQIYILSNNILLLIVRNLINVKRRNVGCFEVIFILIIFLRVVIIYKSQCSRIKGTLSMFVILLFFFPVEKLIFTRILFSDICIKLIRITRTFENFSCTFKIVALIFYAFHIV